MKSCGLKFLILPAAFFCSSLFAQVNSEKILQTSRQRVWHILGHYVSTTVPQVESEADGMDFFLSPRGKFSPEEELRATLEAIQKPAADYENSNQHPQCKFPARTHWLLNYFPEIKTTLPKVTCPDYEEWRRALNATRVSLVFSSYYVNNPASMFGHTFLRFDPPAHEKKHSLLSYSVNFAADTGNDGGVAFAYFGLTGGYPGTFSTVPYYLKVQEYNQFESRDLWEYELTLNEDQIEFMLQHLWELGRTYFHYYFLNENCSYHLLSLVDLVRPDLYLKESLPWWVIPIDTVKEVTKHKDLVRSLIYRPSRLTKAKQRMRDLDEYQTSLLKKTLKAEGSFNNSTLSDAAIEWLAYKHKIPTRTHYQKRLLAERSELSGEYVEPSIAQPSPPHESHDTMRMSIGGGKNSQGTFMNANLRPALHDLLGQDTGYPPFSEIRVMDTEARLYPDTEEIQLKNLTIIGVKSLFPIEPMFFKFSWNVSFGFNTPVYQTCRDCLTSYLEGGPGLAWAVIPEKFIAFTYLNFQFQGSPWSDIEYRVGPKPTMGLIFNWDPYMKTMLAAHYDYSFTGKIPDNWTAHLEQRWSPRKNLELRFMGQKSRGTYELQTHMGIYF